MTDTQFFIRMEGDLAHHLPEFLDRVGMKRCGRLDDDWDQEFGRRELRSHDQGWVELTLWRGVVENTWKVRLTYDDEPLPADEAELLRQRVLEAAAAAGMTITGQSGMESPKGPPNGEMQ